METILPRDVDAISAVFGGAGTRDLLPRPLQQRVLATYRRGQETRKDPSPEYLTAARAAIDAVAQKEGR